MLDKLKECAEKCGCKLCGALAKGVEFVMANKKACLIALACLIVFKLIAC